MKKEKNQKNEKRKAIVLGQYKVEPLYAVNVIFAYEVTSRSKNFKLRVGNSTIMFGLINTFYDKEEMHEYLEVVITMMYQMTMIVPDIDFIKKYTELMNEMITKLAESVTPEQPSEEEALEQMRAVAAVHDIDRMEDGNLYGKAMEAVKEAGNVLKSPK